MQSVDDGDAADEEDENAEENEAVDGNDVVVEETSPRADGAEPHEHREVEKHIDGWLERVVEGFETEPVTAECKQLVGCCREIPTRS